MAKELWQMLGLYLLAMNLAGFFVMAADKRRAKKGAWRISEKALFLPAVLGGSLGCVLGMKVLRHKTRHWYFRFGLPAILVAQLALCAVLAWKFVL